MTKTSLTSLICCLALLTPASGQTAETRSVQGAFGAVTIDGKIWNQIALRPVIPVWKFGLALDLVFYIDQDGNLHRDEWDFSSGKSIQKTLIDKIYYLRFGFKHDPLYFKIGSLDNVYLGYGILVEGYSNAILYPQVRKVGLDFRVQRGQFTVEGFVNDFKENLGLIGLRAAAPVPGGIPVGVTLVVDRNQYLGLKDRDNDGRPDLVDAFPDNRKLWLDSDHDGIADNSPGEWDLDGDGITDTLGPWIPGWTGGIVPLDQDIRRDPEPLNVHTSRDAVAALAGDVGYPILSERNFELQIYAQLAKLIGSTPHPDTTRSTRLSLGMGLIPLGVSVHFGPARLNLEYRLIPGEGRFDFNYWNRSYEIERVTFSATSLGVNLRTKESTLGRIGPMKGVFSRLALTLGSLLDASLTYQNLHGTLWDRSGERFVNRANQSLTAALGLQKQISKLRTAQLFYEQRNVANPFRFRMTASTVMGYRLGFELGSGMLITYLVQRTFRDRDGNGIIDPAREKVNITALETSFTF